MIESSIPSDNKDSNFLMCRKRILSAKKNWCIQFKRKGLGQILFAVFTICVALEASSWSRISTVRPNWLPFATLAYLNWFMPFTIFLTSSRSLRESGVLEREAAIKWNAHVSFKDSQQLSCAFWNLYRHCCWRKKGENKMGLEAFRDST